MEIIKYYKIVVRGNAIGGVLYAPSSWPRPIANDGEEVRNWQALIVELKDGPYRNFNMCVGCANVVSEAFKEVLLEVAGELSRMQARILEQQLINRFGFGANGPLLNLRNEIAPKWWNLYNIKP